MGYNLQEKVQVLVYTFHNLSGKLVFSVRDNFTSILPWSSLPYFSNISTSNKERVTIPFNPALSFLLNAVSPKSPAETKDGVFLETIKYDLKTSK